MMKASDVNETWFNPAFVVSISLGDYRSLTLNMVDGKQVIVPQSHAARVFKSLTGDFWK